MSNVISLAEARKARGLDQEKTLEQSKELFKEGLWSEWKYHLKNGTILEFISKKLGEDRIDWLKNLETVSLYEKDLPLAFALRSPGFTLDNLKGWQAVFVFNELYYETPVLESEQEARVFQLIMFNNLMEELSAKKS